MPIDDVHTEKHYIMVTLQALNNFEACRSIHFWSS